MKQIFLRLTIHFVNSEELSIVVTTNEIIMITFMCQISCPFHSAIYCTTDTFSYDTEEFEPELIPNFEFGIVHY